MTLPHPTDPNLGSWFCKLQIFTAAVTGLWEATPPGGVGGGECGDPTITTWGCHTSLLTSLGRAGIEVGTPKEVPSGKVWLEVSLHSPVSYIIDGHTINF